MRNSSTERCLTFVGTDYSHLPTQPNTSRTVTGRRLIGRRKLPLKRAGHWMPAGPLDAATRDDDVSWNT
jgi:hypothetical protein